MPRRIRLGVVYRRGVFALQRRRQQSGLRHRGNRHAHIRDGKSQRRSCRHHGGIYRRYGKTYGRQQRFEKQNAVHHRVSEFHARATFRDIQVYGGWTNLRIADDLYPPAKWHISKGLATKCLIQRISATRALCATFFERTWAKAAMRCQLEGQKSVALCAS